MLTHYTSSTQVISNGKSVTIVGAGECSIDEINISLAIAPVLVAADGGIETIEKYGLTPIAVIGDMDSAPADTYGKNSKTKYHRIFDQNSTDFDKCVHLLDAELIIGVGVLGPRLDHALASISTIVRNRHRRIILINKSDLCVLAPPYFDLKATKGMRVSLYPMCTIQGKSTGLNWNIDTLKFSPFDQIGTSNHALYEKVTLSFDNPGMLIVLPVSELNSIANSLLNVPLWPFD